MTNNYLFFIGIIVPTVITVVLFVVFLVCARRYQYRHKIMVKKYAPHSKGWLDVSDTNSRVTQKYADVGRATYRDSILNGNYDNLHPESAHVVRAQVNAPREEREFIQLRNKCENKNILTVDDTTNIGKKRPYSRSSTDSEDSGFRSSSTTQILLNHDYSDKRSKNGFRTFSNNVIRDETPILMSLNEIYNAVVVDRQRHRKLSRSECLGTSRSNIDDGYRTSYGQSETRVRPDHSPHQLDLSRPQQLLRTDNQEFNPASAYEMKQMDTTRPISLVPTISGTHTAIYSVV